METSSRDFEGDTIVRRLKAKWNKGKKEFFSILIWPRCPAYDRQVQAGKK